MTTPLWKSPLPWVVGVSAIAGVMYYRYRSAAPQLAEAQQYDPVEGGLLGGPEDLPGFVPGFVPGFSLPSDGFVLIEETPDGVSGAPYVLVGDEETGVIQGVLGDKVQTGPTYVLADNEQTGPAYVIDPGVMKQIGSWGNPVLGRFGPGTEKIVTLNGRGRNMRARARDKRRYGV